jgi:hypothetical protein
MRVMADRDLAVLVLRRARRRALGEAHPDNADGERARRCNDTYAEQQPIASSFKT